ncbi:MAG: hypothetical protein IJO06_00130 [Thermoguttaceae bacterium]|nr:hypothetical protein [Thermoguttaceae bacterium]
MPRAALLIFVSLVFAFVVDFDGGSGTLELPQIAFAAPANSANSLNSAAPDAAELPADAENAANPVSTSPSVSADSPRSSYPAPTSQTAQLSPFRPGLMRVDFTLTNAAATNWDGEIRLSRGSFADMIPLGVAPTCATAFFFSDEAQTCVGLQTVAPLTFCGFQATLFCPRDARLEIKLRDRSTGQTLEKTVLVERLFDSSTRIPLDAQGRSYVGVVRAPADELPARFEKLDSKGATASKPLPARGDSPVFRPGEPFRLTVLPRSSATRLGGDLSLTLNATRRNVAEPFAVETVEIPLAEIQRNDAIVGDPNAAPVARQFVLTAPQEEGVFEIALELRPKPTPRSTFSLAPADGRPFARRVLQGVVVSNRPRTSENGGSAPFDGDLRAELLETIDPTNPGWRGAFSKRFSLPSFRKNDANADAPRNDGAKPAKSGKNDKSPHPAPPRLGIAPFGKSTARYTPSTKKQTAQNAQVANAESPQTLVLGQAPRSTAAPSFDPLNLFDRSGDGKKEFDAEKRAEVLRRWALDRFEAPASTIDRTGWGRADDLWAKPLGGGNSRPFTAEETARLQLPSTPFLRLDPNGTPPRRDVASSPLRLDPRDWFGAAGSHSDSASNSNSAAPADASSAETTVDFATRAAGSLAAASNAVSWEAFPIPIREPGAPHILEIEYPSNFPQKLGVCVLEPSVAGGLFPTSLDFGFVVGAEPFGDRAEGVVRRYAVLFWPRTKTPTILLTNRSSETPAAFGQIRVYRAEGEPNVAAPSSRGGRSFALALTQTNLCDQFAAPRQPSTFGVRGSEDWQTFDDATSRALRYLQTSNFDATALAVVADGTALYPSALLAPTPRADGGVFLPTGADATRKDVLSLTLQKFESRGVSLIPFVKLNAPLPALEARLRQIHSPQASAEERAASEGIEWIGPDGRLLIESRQADDGTGPYYNVLHPETQRAVLAVVDELAARCASSEAFAGLALDVGAGGWLALPDDVYFGMDDATIARFVRESNLQAKLEARGARRVQELLFAKDRAGLRVRAEFIRDVCLKDWLEWRADAAAAFYRDVQKTVAARRPDARLYLVATEALDGPVARSLLYPSLTRASRVREALLRVGLDPTRFAGDPSIVLLRPEIVATTSSLAATAELAELTTPESIALFAAGQAAPGAFFAHRGEKIALPDFDAASPYRPTVVEIENRALPADYENRRRFARQLASADALFFFDGGDRLPFGQEETFRDCVDAFRRLPAVPFRTWEPRADAPDAAKSTQPLVVRYYRNEKETWVYLLNAAPFHLGVELTMKRTPGAAFELFAGTRRAEPAIGGDAFVWSPTLAPFDLVALRVADPKATIETVETLRPAEICGPNGRVAAAVQDFVDRVSAARLGVETPLRNGDFEESFALSTVDAAAELDASNPKTRRQTSSGAARLLGGLEAPTRLFRKSDASAETEPSNAPRPGSASPSPSDSSANAAFIPGWRAFGPTDVDVSLDASVAREGRASLRLSSTGGSGGVVGQPFEAPTTGRLCAQICFGVPVDATSLPLRVCLTARLDGEPYSRQVLVGPTILERARRVADESRPDDGVVWVRDVILFERLPLAGLSETSLRFDLLGAGDVWIDEVKLFKLAFSDDEQKALTRLVGIAEYRVSQERVLDLLQFLDGYWPRALREQIPDDSPLLESRRRITNAVGPVAPSAPPAQPEKKKNSLEKAFDRLKFW